METEILKLFSQFGLSGIIIGVLLLFMFWAARAGMMFMKQTHTDHKEERSQWNEDSNKRSELLNNSLQDLVREIKIHKPP